MPRKAQMVLCVSISIFYLPGKLLEDLVVGREVEMEQQHESQSRRPGLQPGKCLPQEERVMNSLSTGTAPYLTERCSAPFNLLCNRSSYPADRGPEGPEKKGATYQKLPQASQPELRCCLQLCTPRTLQLLVPRRHIPASLYCNDLVLMAFSFYQLSVFYLEINVWMFNRNLLNAERPRGCNICRVLSSIWEDPVHYTIPLVLLDELPHDGMVLK